MADEMAKMSQNSADHTDVESESKRSGYLNRLVRSGYLHIIAN